MDKFSFTAREGNAPSVFYFNSDVYTGVSSQSYRRNVIGMVLQGRKAIVEGDRQVVIEMGDLFLLERGTYLTDDLPHHTGHFRQLLLFFTDEEFATLLADLSPEEPFLSESRADPDYRHYVIEASWTGVANYFRNLVASVASRTTHFDDSFDRDIAREILYSIAMNEDSAIRRRLFSLISTRCSRLCEEIGSRLLEGCSVDAIAREKEMSPTMLRRRFVDYYGMSPHRWIVRQRVQESKILLMTTEMSIAEISSHCHFSNPSHFIANFKDKFHVTPAQFRKGERMET